MTEIRYWSNSNDVVAESNSEKRKRSQAVSQFNQSLQMSLMNQMSGKDPFSGLNGSFIGTDMTNNLMNIDVEGKEKIWAAQLSSPMSFFDNGFMSGGKSGGSMSALDSVVSLSVQAELVKAREKFQQETNTFSLQDFIQEASPGIATGPGKQYQSIDSFVAFIHSEIEKASGELGIDKKELIQYLDL